MALSLLSHARGWGQVAHERNMSLAILRIEGLYRPFPEGGSLSFSTPLGFEGPYKPFYGLVGVTSWPGRPAGGLLVVEISETLHQCICLRPRSSASGCEGLHKSHGFQAVLCEVYAGSGQDHGYKGRFHARRGTFAKVGDLRPRRKGRPGAPFGAPAPNEPPGAGAGSPHSEPGLPQDGRGGAIEAAHGGI
jgi:hypothetical protein